MGRIQGMSIFRRRSKFSSQTDFDDVSLMQRLREDLSQSSEWVERFALWIGDSRARIALVGAATILALLLFWFITILLFGTPGDVDREFTAVHAAQLSQVRQLDAPVS